MDLLVIRRKVVFIRLFFVALEMGVEVVLSMELSV